MSILRSEPWTDRAVCRNVDPEAFYALGHGGTAKDWTTAREACASCPVAAQCLADAIAAGDAHGFRAGHTPDELARMMPRQTRQPVPITHGTASGARQHHRRGERPCTACARAANIARRLREESA